MTSIAHTAARTATLRPALHRFAEYLASVGDLALDAVEASRAIESAHSTETRRLVLDRFAAQTARHADRTAA